MIARVLAEKDTLRCQLVELQERFFSLKTDAGARERRHSSDVNQNTTQQNIEVVVTIEG